MTQPTDQQNKSKKKCPFQNCNKKLQLVDMKCKCDHIFCSAHRLPESHQCTFDHGMIEWSRLVTKLFDEKVTRPKMTDI